MKKYNSISEIIHSKSFLEIAEGIRFRETLNYKESQYDGMPFEVVRELGIREYDRQDRWHRKYEIKLENGVTMYAHDHEVELGVNLAI